MADARLNVILSLTDRFSTNLKSINRTLAQNQDLLKRVSLAASAFSIASVLAIRSFARAAIDSKQAQASLEAAVKAAGGSFAEFKGPIDDAIKHLTKFSDYSKDELKGALKDLIIAIGDVPMAIKALQTAADLAAASNTDLGTSATQVGRFMRGEIDAIRGVTSSIDPGLTNPLERLVWLQKQVAGQALANINPFKQFGNQVNDTKAIIGKFIVDDLEPLLKKLGEVLVLVEKLPPGWLDFGVKVGLVATAFAILVGALSGLALAWLIAEPVLIAMGVWTLSLGGLAVLALAVAITAAAEAWPRFVEEMDKAQKKMEEPSPELAKPGGFWSTDWWGPFVTWYETSWPKWLKDWDGFVAGWKTFFGTKWEILLPDWLFKPITLPEINFTESWNKFWGGTWFTITLPDWLTKPITLPKIKFPEMKLPELNWGDMLSTLQTAWINFWAGLGMPWEPIREDIADFFDAVSTDWLRFWDSLERGWTQLWSTLNELFNLLTSPITEGWKRFTDGLGTIFKPAANFIIGLAEGMANAVITAVNVMINALNMIQIPDWMPGVGGKGINISNVPSVTIPRLAEGGIVTTPTLAMIGERGPEAVIPLRGQRGGGLTINFNGPVYGFEQFEKKVGQAVRDIASRGGFYGIRLGSNA